MPEDKRSLEARMASSWLCLASKPLTFLSYNQWAWRSVYVYINSFLATGRSRLKSPEKRSSDVQGLYIHDGTLDASTSL